MGAGSSERGVKGCSSGLHNRTKGVNFGIRCERINEGSLPIVTTDLGCTHQITAHQSTRKVTSDDQRLTTYREIPLFPSITIPTNFL